MFPRRQGSSSSRESMAQRAGASRSSRYLTLHEIPYSLSSGNMKDSPSGPSRGWAIQKVRGTVKRLQASRSDLCAPQTFRTVNKRTSGKEPRLADHGGILFTGRAMTQPASFIHLADTRQPYKSPEEYACSIVDMMERHWGLGKASVIMSITGGAQDFALPPRLHKAFAHGLAKAAQATSAWVFTGGTDSGVMQLVGRALA
eukprot:2748998-Prymnesium_polylepis.1